MLAVDKFTKWIETVPITNLAATTAVNFIKSIIYPFGMPSSIIADYGTKFTAEEF